LNTKAPFCDDGMAFLSPKQKRVFVKGRVKGRTRLAHFAQVLFGCGEGVLRRAEALQNDIVGAFAPNKTFS
jgi:hypothetical protein